MRIAAYTVQLNNSKLEKTCVFAGKFNALTLKNTLG
jgi:hypothetical protein